jgi:hypothetical protein
MAPRKAAPRRTPAKANSPVGRKAADEKRRSTKAAQMAQREKSTPTSYNRARRALDNQSETMLTSEEVDILLRMAAGRKRMARNRSRKPLR